MNAKTSALVLSDDLGNGSGFSGDAPGLPMRWEARAFQLRATVEDFARELRIARIERLKEQAFRLMARATTPQRCNQMMCRHYQLVVARDDMGY